MLQAQRSGEPTPSDPSAFSWPYAPRILPAAPREITRAGFVKGMAARAAGWMEVCQRTRDRQGQMHQDGTSDLARCPMHTPHPTHTTYNARQYREGSRGSLHMAVRIALYRSRLRRSGLGRKSHRRNRCPSCNCASARFWTKAAQAHPPRASLDVAPPRQEAPAFRASVLETARHRLSRHLLSSWEAVLEPCRDARHVLPPAPDRSTNTRRRNKGLTITQAQRSRGPIPSDDSSAFSWPCTPRILPAGASKE
jgi:hypothetical protein